MSETPSEASSDKGQLPRRTLFGRAFFVALAVATGAKLGGGHLVPSFAATPITWYYPFKTKPVHISSDYGPRPSPGPGASTDHKGVDFDPGAGTEIVAAAWGTVLNFTTNSAFGNYVTIDHGSGWISGYAHMQAGSVRVAKNQAVAAGTVLGRVGATGTAYGAHLHFEIRQDGTLVNPLPYIQNAEVATGDEDLTPEQDARLKNIEAILAIDNGGGMRAVINNNYATTKNVESIIAVDEGGGIRAIVRAIKAKVGA